ncbi:MAG: HlyC/CorC family transporter [Proteobacteria bacterium]|nr:MAG: HlyC/CorC family transporter [Pseudomonadota bacterium]
MNLSVLASEFTIIVALALLNGALSMSEMAMVSARRMRLQKLASEGSSRAKTALALINEPSNFLAAIQIGITAIGVFAGAFGGANIAEQLQGMLETYPIVAPYAEGMSIGSVVFVVTLLSLVLGELVPKRLALGHADTISLFVAKPIRGLAWIATPAVKCLSLLTEGILKLLRYKDPTDGGVTEDEVRMMVEQGTETGVFEKSEESIIKRTFRLSDQRVDEVMTQRLQLVSLDIEDPLEDNLKKIVQSNHTFFPIYEGTIDKVIGIVSVKKLFGQHIAGFPINLRNVMEEPLFVAESTAALKLLEMFKSSGKHFAIIIDEYGGLSGVATIMDMLEGIFGDMPDASQGGYDEFFQREDGTWLVDGISNLTKVEDVIGFPEKNFLGTEYQTLGGFLMGELGRIPVVGDTIAFKSYRFEVMDMDGNRVDKVLITVPPPSNLDEDTSG